MLYETYQVQSDVFAPIRWLAQTTQGVLNQPWPLLAHHPLVRSAAAACELVSRAHMGHERPDFRIAATAIAGHFTTPEDL